MEIKQSAANFVALHIRLKLKYDVILIPVSVEFVDSSLTSQSPTFTSTSGNSFHNVTVKADIFRIPDFLCRIARLLNNEDNFSLFKAQLGFNTAWWRNVCNWPFIDNHTSCVAGGCVSRISQISDFSKTGRTELWWYFWSRILPYPRVFLISVFCPILIGIFVLCSKQNLCTRTKEVTDSLALILSVKPDK